MVQEVIEQPFVPAYRIPIRNKPEQRCPRLADAVSLLADRLDRLQDVYPHWRRFDAGAYFDLHKSQVDAMLRIEWLGATLDVTLHADLISPAFHNAERYWADKFCPAYHAMGQQEDAYTRNFWQYVLPAMQRRMQKAREEIAATGELLFQRGDMTFLVSACAPDERERHVGQLPTGDEDYASIFLDIPTLTLSRSFDLLEMGRRRERDQRSEIRSQRSEN